MTRKYTKKASGPLAPKPEDEKIFGENGEPEELKPDEQPEPETAPEPAAAPTQFAAEPEPEPAHAPEPEPRRERRGRPAGGKNKKRSSGTRETDSPENLSKLLLSVHQMLSAFLDIPELLLSQEEADKLGQAVAEVEALYSDVPFVSPEVRAFANLGITSIVIYWPRYKVIKMRLDKEARAQADIDVTPIRPPTTETPNMSREGTGTIKSN